VTWGGRALELEGRRLQVGDVAPDAATYDTDYQAARLSSYRGKVVLLSVVPEFGTPVCDQTTQRLEHLAGGLGPGVAVLTVSRDSVWDQRDWCRQRGIERVAVLSDDQLREFGRAYGLSIRGRDALMRAMLVLDREGVIRHIEVVDDVSHHPDIGAAVAAARALSRKPAP
jgi:thiol peroxidase